MKEPRTLVEVLCELSDTVDASETPRETALLAIGYVLGVALRAGWTLGELVDLRAWPARTVEMERADETPEQEKQRRWPGGKDHD
jgi:hypothetical protein